MASTHFASAHFASVHFLSNHFSGGTEQILQVPFDDVGNEGVGEILRRLPNGHIIVIATAALLICNDDLDF